MELVVPTQIRVMTAFSIQLSFSSRKSLISIKSSRILHAVMLLLQISNSNMYRDMKPELMLVQLVNMVHYPNA